MRLIICTLFFTSILAVPVAAAPPPPPAAPRTAAPRGDARTAVQVQAAAEFTFESVSLGMSLKEFLEKYPKAELGEDESNDKVGLKSYRVNELETADSARYVFLDDVLIQMTAFYSPERLKEMGGETIPLRKLVQKFGKQDKNSPGVTRQDGEQTFTAKWDFAGPRRCIRFVAGQKMSYISIVDTSRSGIAGKRETENAELGF
jgi:hypothetical protein